MKKINRMIFQVAVGPQSKLYEHCIKSVSQYCAKHDITHHILHAVSYTHLRAHETG